MLVPNRNYSSNAYRYGYQGSEKDDDVKGEGKSYTTHFRQLDPRIGRWLSRDPKATSFETPYSSMGNNPIIFNDILGDTLNIGKNTLSKTDIKSLVRKKNRKYLNFSSNGRVTINLTKLPKGTSKNSLLGSDEGLNLINDLVSSPKKTLYEASDIALLRTFNGTPIGKEIWRDRNGVINSSDYGLDSNGALTTRPMTGYDGQLIIGTKTSWEELDKKGTSSIKKSRASIVFHELAENYERTHKNNNYLGGFSSGSDVFSFYKKGAHESASNREKLWFGVSNTPGAVSKIINPKPSRAIRFNNYNLIKKYKNNATINQAINNFFAFKFY